MVVHHTIWSWAWWIHMLGWDAWPTGIRYGIIYPYSPWSGSVSDFGLIAAAGAFFTHTTVLWKSHTCHRHWWCWRKPQFQLGDTPYWLCHVHHPEEQPTVHEAVADYVADKELTDA